jgi:hypothetical protein
VDELDLSTYLLVGALQASRAIEQLNNLAASCPGADPAAAADIAQAIRTMTDVRSRLIRDADHVAAAQAHDCRRPAERRRT